MRGKIFINYRRSDSMKDAYLIAARLKDRYGANNVFIDENLSGGQIFSKTLEKRLAQCSVMLIVIGSDWLQASGEDGRRRLDNLDDWVRHEIRRGLEHKIWLVPVLINGAAVPTRNLLPDDIAGLVDRHAVPLRTDGEGFRGDMTVLIDSIDRLRNNIWPAIATITGVLLLAGWIGAYQLGVTEWIPTIGGLTKAVEKDDKPKAEEEVRRIAEAEAKGKVDDEARRVAEAEAKRKANDEARRLAEAEAKRKANDEARRLAEAEAERKANEAKETQRKAGEQPQNAAKGDVPWYAEKATPEVLARNEAKAEAEALAALARGDIKTMRYVADRYASGSFVSINFDKARYWYEKAASLGDTYAIYKLAELYYAGKVVAQDFVKARELFEVAAAKGVRNAMVRLGHIYGGGAGTIRNCKLALYWYRKDRPKTGFDFLNKIISDLENECG